MKLLPKKAFKILIRIWKLKILQSKSQKLVTPKLNQKTTKFNRIIFVEETFIDNKLPYLLFLRVYNDVLLTACQMIRIFHSNLPFKLTFPRTRSFDVIISAAWFLVDFDEVMFFPRGWCWIGLSFFCLRRIRQQPADFTPN